MNRLRPWSVILWLVVMVVIVLPESESQGAGPCEIWVAKLVSAEGTAETKTVHQPDWRPADIGETFCPGDSLRIQKFRAAVVLNNETILRLDAGTILTFTKLTKNEPTWLDLLAGMVHFISRVPWSLTITTPFVNGFVEGTEFVIRVDPARTSLWVFEGQVLATNPFGTLALTRGHMAVAEPGQSPQRVTVANIRDAVQWALYFPPIIDFRTFQGQGPAAAPIQRALEAYRRGDPVKALEQLETVPSEHRDVSFFILRAGLLLSVGRVEQARIDLDAVSDMEPDNGVILALQSMIELVKHDKTTALQLAHKAKERSPESPVPWIALSYAYQAAFDLEKAHASVQFALNQAPDNALAWARLSELWLMRGYISRALEAAEEAVARNPGLARTHMVMGFAYLAQFKNDAAKLAFQRAAQLDQAAPLSRLGLGLAEIREGDVDEGRRNIEIAASLDPDQSLIRSYLGKAYFEERRSRLAGTQFDMAKELDPEDPTPWFYDAIRKQLINRPVEALHDLQTSIHLNDARAVYRSRLLLDQDEAVRNAAIGRIYQTLNFRQRALVEGWYGLAADPASHSSHRLLADTYSVLPRHDIARVSELLQAQLLQELNTNNLQPELAERNIQILEGAGPAISSFNEFNPLFMRNNVRLLGTGMVGNLDTSAYSLVPSILYDRFSVSGGIFQYRTDGFRPNNDVDETIYNVFGQAALTSKLNIQAEFRKRNSEQGDVAFNFDPDNFQSSFRQDTEQTMYRMGARYALAPHSDFLVSYIHGEFEQDVDQIGLSSTNKQDRDQVEAQYLFRHEVLTATVGGRWSKGEQQTRLFFDGVFNSQLKDNPKDAGGYVYLNIKWPHHVIWTGGFAVESIDNVSGEEVRVNPKAGVQWNITPSTRLRLGYFQRLQRRLVIQQTIEPTQVAGFNQLFDDINAAHTERWGAGLDMIVTDSLYAGVEYSLRKIQVPLIQVETFQTERFERWEDLARGYVYWTPHSQWAVSVQVEFEQFRRSVDEPSVMFRGDPPKVSTVSLPGAIRYFHPNGLFAGVQGTFVRQWLDLAPPSGFFTPLNRNDDSFFLVDASIGYRLPKRFGIFSLEVRNLFDTEFFYQDQNIQVAEQTVTPRFFPTRTVLGRLTLSF